MDRWSGLLAREGVRRLLVVLALVGTPCLAQWPALIGWKSCNPYYLMSGLADSLNWIGGTCVVDGNVGNTVQALGGLSADLWLKGQIPWWDHYAAAGLPLAATMQPGSFFLPFVLLLKLFDGPMYLKLAVQCLSGLFTYGFLREAGLRRSPSLLAGLLFSLNGSFAYFSDAPVFPIPFLPLLMLGIVRCRRALEEKRPGGPLLVALAIAYSLLAGFPETALMDGLFAFGWLAIEMARLGDRRAAWLAARVCGGGIVGLLLAAPALVPFLQLLPHSSLGVHLMVLRNRFRLDQLAGLLFPTLFGAPLQDGDVDAWGGVWGYLGAAATVLGLVGLAAGWRDPRRLFAAGWILFMVAAMCRAPGIDFLRQHLPGLALVDFRRYPAASCEFAVLLLASFALDDWQVRRGTEAGGARRRRSRAIAGLGFLGLAAASLALAEARLAEEVVRTPAVRFYAIATVLEALAVAAALLWLLGRPATRTARIALLAVGLADALIGFMVPVWHGRRPAALDLAPIAYLQAHQGFSRLHSIGPRLVPNYAGLFGLASIDDMFLPVPKTWDQQAARLDPHLFGFMFVGVFDPHADDLISHRALFEDFGTRFILVATKYDSLENTPGFIRVFDGARTRIYELPGAKPYLQIASGHCSLTEPERDRQTATCDGPAVLLRREMTFPGWEALVNGHKAAIVTQPPIFQGIALPAGRSRIVWRYRPAGSGTVALLFGGGLLALMALLAAAAWPDQAAGLRRRSANCLRNLTTLGATTARQ